MILGHDDRNPYLPRQCARHMDGRGTCEGLAETCFAMLNVDRVLLEYDDERSGTLAPLRFMPKGRQVVLGLVTTKHPQL